MNVSRSDLTRIVVAIDPAATSGETADDTGIVVVARGPHQPDTCEIPQCTGHGYVLEDATCHLPPHGWAEAAIAAYDRWQADRVIAEVNNGGDMVGATIHAVRVGVPYSKVTATRGKRVRAEPVSALYEQGRVHHLGVFRELEQELETWTPDEKWSPNRLDALVWGLTYLGLIGGQGAAFLQAWETERDAITPAMVAARPLAGIPRLENTTDRPLKPGCQHRWRQSDTGDYCVECGGERETNQ